MLYNIAQGIQRMALNAIRAHPNSWSVQFFRKVVDRTAPESYGGLPTLGGLAQLDSQDEPAYHYEFLCNGYARRPDQYAGSGMSMAEAKDAPMGGADEFLYMLAPELPAPASLDEPAPAPVELTTKDVVLFVLGDTPDAARVAFEIATIEPMMELPPYLPRYVLIRRADMDLAEGIEVPDHPALAGDETPPGLPDPAPEMLPSDTP